MYFRTAKHFYVLQKATDCQEEVDGSSCHDALSGFLGKRPALRGLPCSDFPFVRFWLSNDEGVQETILQELKRGHSEFLETRFSARHGTGSTNHVRTASTACS
jgi:hypothetical protein